MITDNTLITKVNNWIKNSVTLKLAIITILMLLLLVPTIMIKGIIGEREKLSKLAIDEVSSKWADSQEINGPILTIPLIYESEQDGKITTTSKYWHLLPANLNIDGEIEPEKLKRGIYEIVVYKSQLAISGDFDLSHQPDIANLKEIKYDQSFITIGISDLRGIKNQINFRWDGQNLNVKPGSKISELAYSGVTVDLPGLGDKINNNLDFDFSLKLHGSKNISFIPAGGKTTVSISSSWPSPSFNGNFLPDEREISKEGFNANWQILQLNRNFPQSWVETDQGIKMKEAAFGVDLILPLDDYQKSMRSAKYAVMTIALTFLVFFLVEILNKRKIHPFQYILVGLALCLFYILLVAITEHTNFNFAFVLSSLAIISMVSLYSLSIFKDGKLTSLLLTTLSGIYGFLFITLQLADYALLMGSIGLSLILGTTMYFTRKINWYKLNIKTE